nr:hypothetical protein [Tanacetum cinerariifolium]
QELKTVSYHKLYDILKQHQYEVNEIRAEKIARIANPLALVAQQQSVYHPQQHPTQFTRNSSTRSQQAATRNRGKAIVNSPQPIYDQESSMVAEDEETSKDNRANQDNSPRINRNVGYENQRIGNVVGARENVGSSVVQKSRIQCYNCKEFEHVARECQKPKRAKDAAYHREKMLLCKQEEARIQLNAEQADWRDDINDDELEDQEQEAHYMYMTQLQEVSLDAADSGPIFDDESVQKVSNDDHYNVEEIDQNDDDNDFAKERVIPTTSVSRPQLKGNPMGDRVMRTSSQGKKQEVEDQRRNVKLSKNKTSVTACNNSLNVKTLNVKSVCATYDKCVLIDKHDICVLNSVAKPIKETVSSESNKKPRNFTRKIYEHLVKIVLFIVDSRCSKHMTGNLKLLINFVKKFLRTVKFRNDQIAPIIGYGDLVQGAVTIKRVYYVEGLNHNLFSVGQFCDANLEVALRKDGENLEKMKEKDQISSDPAPKCQTMALNHDSLSPTIQRQGKTLPPNKKSILKNTNVLAPGMYKIHIDHNQIRTSQLPPNSRKTNKRVSFSTGVIPTTSVSRPHLKGNPMGDRVMRNSSQGKKQEVEDQCTNVKLSKNKTSVTECNNSLNVKTLNVKYVCATCDKCVLIDKHDICVLNSVAKPIKETFSSESNKKPRNFTRKIYEHVSKTCSWWYPKFTPSGYKWKPTFETENLVNIFLFIVDSGCSKHMTGNLKLLINFVKKFLRTVKFRNDQITPILGYGDLVQGAVTINRVYYVEGLNHNLFSVGQFCNTNLEVAFRKSTCYIRDLKGNDLLTDHLCSSSELGKAKRKSFHTKLTPSSKRWLQLLHMDLCGPMRVASINGKRYVLVIVDDYSRYTWTHFLRSKDETPEVLIDFLRLVQRALQAQVRVVARIMLSAAKVPLFFWAEAIATACFTQNRSLVIPHHKKTPYHIINDRKPSVKFFHIFGSMCYIVRDGENLDKIKEKGDECIFVGYSTQSRAYRVFNKRTRVIMESIQVNFDELPQMASDQLSSDPTPECQTMTLNHYSLSLAIQRHKNVPQADRTVTTLNEPDLLFSLMFDELLNGSSKVVSKSSVVSAADAPNQCQHHTIPLNNHTTPAPICQVPTLAPTVISSENINQAETYVENDQVVDDEFINIFSTPVQDQGRRRHIMLICQICTPFINDIPLNIVGQKIIH